MKTTNKTLAQLCETAAGLHFRGKVENDPDGNAALIQIKDLDANFTLQTDALERVKLDKVEPYLVRSGDVLFVARGARLGATVIENAPDDAIATGSFFRLRTRGEVMPAFVAWTINSTRGQQQLRRAEQGTGLTLVRRADLESLLIEVPPLATQRAIVALDAGARRERELCEQLQQKRARWVEAVAARAMKI